MKFGICTGFQKQENGFVIPNLDFMLDMGFDYLELALNAITPLSDSDFGELKRYLSGLPIPVLACNCFMEGSVKLTGESYSRDKTQEYVRKAVSRARELKVKKLVLGSAGSRNIPVGYSVKKGEEEFFESLKIISDECFNAEIELELEHLNRGESNIITTFEESSSVALSGEFKGLKSIFDYYHFALGNEPLSLLADRKAAVGHIHFARALGRTFPEIGDMESLTPVFDAIKKTGYNDTFSMECSFPKMEEKPSEYILVLKEFKRIFG